MPAYTNPSDFIMELVVNPNDRAKAEETRAALTAAYTTAEPPPQRHSEGSDEALIGIKEARLPSYWEQLLPLLERDLLIRYTDPYTDPYLRKGPPPQGPYTTPPQGQDCDPHRVWISPGFRSLPPQDVSIHGLFSHGRPRLLWRHGSDASSDGSCGDIPSTASMFLT